MKTKLLRLILLVTLVPLMTAVAISAISEVKSSMSVNAPELYQMFVAGGYGS